MKKLLLGICTCALISSSAFAQNNRTLDNDETAIRAIIDGLSAAWTESNAQAFSAPFVEDADFTVWTGLRIKGREAITRGHDQIFTAVYKDTKLRFTVQNIRFVKDDVAIVLTEAAVVKKTEDFPAVPQNVQTFVMSKDKGKWQIVAFQNTPIQRRP